MCLLKSKHVLYGYFSVEFWISLILCWSVICSQHWHNLVHRFKVNLIPQIDIYLLPSSCDNWCPNVFWKLNIFEPKKPMEIHDWILFVQSPYSFNFEQELMYLCFCVPHRMQECVTAVNSIKVRCLYIKCYVKWKTSRMDLWRMFVGKRFTQYVKKDIAVW